MPDLKFNWNSLAQVERVASASHDALSRASLDAEMWWDAVAPVGTDPRTSGDLKRMWFSDVVGGEDTITLVFGSLSQHAIYVELGTYKMEPRAPIRQVAGEIMPFIPHYLWESLTDGSGRSR